MIDTHQHYWDLSRFTYRWIQPDTILARNYHPDDALPLMQTASVRQCVTVEAGADQAEELVWLLELAAAHDHIAGVVGCINLTGDVSATLAALPAQHQQWLKGVRINIMDPAADYSRLDNGLQALAAQQLTCDLLMRPAALPQAAALIQAHPNVMFILDHFAGGRITPGGHTAWQQAVAPLADLPNTVLKVSGYLTAADPMPPTLDTLNAYFDCALALFGTARLMYGSDWPVCLSGGSYQASVDNLKSLIGALSPDEQADITERTAIKTYRL
jgi:L-fuconolactonase